MKKLFKLGCGGIIALIVIIIVIALASGGDDETSTSTDSNKTNSTSKEEKQVANIGTPLEVGNAVFTLNSVELADQVGPSVLPEKANGKYVVLDVTYKNNGNDAVTIDASFFKLIRGEKKYESDSMASMSANQGEDGTIQNSFFLQEVNPDMEITGKVVFDLAPDVAEATDLKLQVQTGAFGTETGIINLK